MASSVRISLALLLVTSLVVYTGILHQLHFRTTFPLTVFQTGFQTYFSEEEIRQKSQTYSSVVSKHFGNIPYVLPSQLMRWELSSTDYQKFIKEFCARSELLAAKSRDELCPCDWSEIVGYRAPKWRINKSFARIKQENPEVKSGGIWAPTGCLPRYRVAMIVPYMNRPKQLPIFLNHIHPFLRRQGLSYRIFLVQQISPPQFNKAMLMNTGYVQAKEMGHFDCFIFHDVDMLPEDDRNIYICGNKPRHVGFLVQKFRYRLTYDNLFGGATAFTSEQFESVNGFSNSYYGWGGEDDDIFRRVHIVNNESIRFPRSVSRYTMIPHRRDNPINPKNIGAIETRPAKFKEDGLNTLTYTLNGIKLEPLYTLIDVSLPKPIGDVT